MPIEITYRLMNEVTQVLFGLLAKVARQSHLLIGLWEPEERRVDRGHRSGLGHVVLAGNDCALVAVSARGVADTRRHDAPGVLPWVYLENPAHISAKIPECRPERRLRLFLERRFVCADREVAVFLLVVLKDELPFCRLDLLDGDVHDCPPLCSVSICAGKGRRVCAFLPASCQPVISPVSGSTLGGTSSCATLMNLFGCGAASSAGGLSSLTSTASASM